MLAVRIMVYLFAGAFMGYTGVVTLAGDRTNQVICLVGAFCWLGGIPAEIFLRKRIGRMSG